MSFDLGNSDDDPVIQLVIHLPIENDEEKTGFQQIHTVATARISKDGDKVVDTTLNPIPRKGKS